MLNWRPWLSVQGFSRDPLAKLALTGLLLVQVLAPNWIIWTRNGTVPLPEPGTAHGFRIASGAGQQSVICFYRSTKPLAARVALLRGTKVVGREVFSPAPLVQSLPGRISGAPSVFALDFKFADERAAPLRGPLNLRISDHPGRAPPAWC